uniref:Uncharacterized protein n=2 Tax=Arundo donax TaxID=35708 RepID=A0A0A9BE22_ARUDO
MRPAVEALRRHGLKEKAISRVLTIQLGVLVMPLRRIDEICKDLEALGLSSHRLPLRLRLLCDEQAQEGDMAAEDGAVPELWGCFEGELLKVIRTQPTIMLISEENIKEKRRFFMDVLKLELSDVMERPVIIAYGFKKCILPRCAVLSVLMREGKIERDINLLRALIDNSKGFSEKYVLRYADDMPDVVKAYGGKIKFEGFTDRDALVPLKQ